MTPIISQDEMAAYLGRSLSTVETENYELYIELAQSRLEDLLCTKIVKPLPTDLALTLARCFAVISLEQNEQSDLNVTSKKVEDFSLTRKSGNEAETPMASFMRLNDAILTKYSRCQGCIRSGKIYGDCIRCI